MQTKSLAQRILNSNKPFIFYHHHRVTEKGIHKAIEENRSIHLDVCVDSNEKPYIGHSEEYYKKNSKKMEENISLNRALELLSKSTIPVFVDCKHYDTWALIEDVVEKLGQERCLVNTFADELKFNYNPIEPDYLSEWSDISKLEWIKEKYPLVTTVASAKGLPVDLSLRSHSKLLTNIRSLLVSNNIDDVSLNVSSDLYDDELIAFFTSKKMLPHIMFDGMQTSELTYCCVGEVEVFEKASSVRILHK